MVKPTTTPSRTQDIDFLPAQCRQRRLRRKSQPWRIIVVAAFAALLAGAAYAQYSSRRRAEEELAILTPQYELAFSQENRLAKIDSRLQTARTRADLLTYLRHPWPRTQLLASLLAPLPDEITFRQLQILRETPQARAPTERRSRPERKADQEEDQKLSPAARDLKRLREECDKTRTLVLISGTTTESAALHAYLGKLGEMELFAKAELDSSETAENDRSGLLQFRATLVVRPGYGQPNGPSGPEENAVAQSTHRRKEGDTR